MNDQTLVNRPLVAKSPRRTGVAIPMAALTTLGVAVFFWLAEARAANEQSESALPTLQATSTPAPAEAPSDETAATAPATPLFIPNSGPVTLQQTVPQQGAPPFSAPFPQAPPPRVDSARERLRAPTLVVDLAQADPVRTPGSRGELGVDGRSGPAPLPGAPPGQGADASLSDTERFSSRIGKAEVEIAQAQRMTGLDRLVPQGAIMGAVMETALNSDLPGYARAVIQRDVYSFDGTAVLIPAGSRLIGQYKSGVAQGASRVFVLWTRLIRPDGVSIDLASPAVDELGRGGLGGKVNRHFFQRFGGAILSSVLTAGVSAATAGLAGGSTVIVGSAGQAANLAGQAVQSNDIPPTITTRQGAGVRVFVARDLDFSKVGPAR